MSLFIKIQWRVSSGYRMGFCKLFSVLTYPDCLYGIEAVIVVALSDYLRCIQRAYSCQTAIINGMSVFGLCNAEQV